MIQAQRYVVGQFMIKTRMDVVMVHRMKNRGIHVVGYNQEKV